MSVTKNNPPQPYPIPSNGKSRLLFSEFTVRPYTGFGDTPLMQSQFSVVPAQSDLRPFNRSKGKDSIGAFEKIDLKAREGFISGRLSLKHYPSLNVSAASFEAAGFSEEWWRGYRFGLSGEGTVVLKFQLPGFSQGVTSFMSEEWWCKSSFPRKASEVLPLTRFLAWREKDGLYGCLLPLSGGDTVSHLKGTPGGLELRSSTFNEGQLQAKGPLFVMAFGRDPYETVERAYDSALRFLGYSAKPRLKKKFPEPFKLLGWCTWDALMREVNSRQMTRQLEHFRKAGFNLGFVLIDDGWYFIKDNMLVDSREDKAKFPEGLSGFIRKAKKKYGIPYIGVWQALTGYWAGVHPQNRLSGEMKETLMETKGWPTVPSLEFPKAFKFWKAWHRWAKAQGVDFVKVDGQGHVLRYSRNLMPAASASSQAQQALQKSVNLHFKGNIINCMGMGPELSWNWASSNVARSSDDFILNGKECEPAIHGRQNAYNSYALSYLTWCDWDMFWSASKYADYHQALRALSGGPIYVSDKVGAFKIDKIWPLVLKDGRILRCDTVGMPTADCLFHDPLKSGVLKIMNRAGEAGVIGLFNGFEKGKRSSLAFRPSDIRGLQGKEFAVWGFHEKKGRKMGFSDTWKIQLKPAQVSVFIVQPISKGFAPIGIVDKLIAPKTLRHWAWQGNRAVVSLWEGGHFAAYSSREPLQARVGGKPVIFNYENNWIQLYLSHTKPAEVVFSF